MAVRQSLRNQEFLHQLTTPGMEKTAAERLNSVVRLMVREGSIDRQVLVPETITYSDLDRQQDTEVMVKIVDVEPNAPAAFSAGFATASPMIWLSAKRVRATFNRLQTPEALYDVELLGTWEADIQQIFAENMARDILAREDGQFFNGVRTFVGPVDTLHPVLGSYPHVTIHGGYTRETLIESTTIMMKSVYRLPPETAVISNVTAQRILSLGREEMGGDTAEQTFRDGFRAFKMLGLNWIPTIKRHIVEDDTIYYFTDPRAIGKMFILTDVTTYMRTEAFHLRFFSWTTLSQVLANPAGLAIAKIA